MRGWSGNRGGNRNSPAPAPRSAEEEGVDKLQRIREMRHFVNGEWFWDVVLVLDEEPRGFTELLNTVRARTTDDGWPGKRHRYLQESILGRTLRRLEKRELVSRQQEGVFPYRVTYRLTSPAQELVTAVEPLVEWTRRHDGLVERVRNKA